jgi:hypothetical protein
VGRLTLLFLLLFTSLSPFPFSLLPFPFSLDKRLEHDARGEPPPGATAFRPAGHLTVDEQRAQNCVAAADAHDWRSAGRLIADGVRPDAGPDERTADEVRLRADGDVSNVAQGAWRSIQVGIDREEPSSGCNERDTCAALPLQSQLLGPAGDLEARCDGISERESRLECSEHCGHADVRVELVGRTTDKVFRLVEQIIEVPASR